MKSFLNILKNTVKILENLSCPLKLAGIFHWFELKNDRYFSIAHKKKQKAEKTSAEVCLKT